MSRLLLLSNSTLPGTPFLSWPEPFIEDFLAGEKGPLLFIPFAAVTLSYDEYYEAASQAFGRMGYELSSIHQAGNYDQAIRDAAGIVIGGGNTFALLNLLYHHDLVGIIREKVRWGVPYIGWSAGANVACPGIMTTNDMPIVMPLSFEALDLVPFQINPHYTDFRQPGHGGESREQRIREFLMLNTDKRVVGLPEGTLLSVGEQRMILKGHKSAALFIHDKPVETFEPGADLSFLLHS